MGDGETRAAEESTGEEGNRQGRLWGGGALAKLALSCLEVGRTFRVGGGHKGVKAGDRTGSSCSRLWGTGTLEYPP